MIDVKQYKKACKYYKETWELLNDVLYQLCRDNHGHSSLSVIIAKFYIIGRTYATGIERIRRNLDNEKSDLRDLSKYILENRKSVEPIFEKLSEVREPLSIENLKVIVKMHGKFLNLLTANLQGGAPRSFASKYLHFHCPAVPIFDSIANGEISRGQRWNTQFELFPMPEGADQDYYRFAMRFWRCYSDAKEKRLYPCPDVRLIDNYLLYMADNMR